MADNTTGWWYSLVAVAPRPETGEAVNVGLLIGNGRPLRLEYEPGLPRLAGIVGRNERRVYDRLLFELAGSIGGIEVGVDLAALSPQIRVSDPRELYSPPNEDVLRALRNSYLTAPRRTEGIEARKLVRQAERRLDRIIGAAVHFGIRDIEKDVTPSKLYGEAAEFVGDIKVPRLARALRAQQKDLLVDAVLLRPGETDLAIRSATQRIGRAFWYYKRLEHELRERRGTEIRRVGVVVTPDESSREVQEAAAFITHSWVRDASVITAHNGDGAPKLREHVAWLIAPGSR
jgi:hypothetical protein